MASVEDRIFEIARDQLDLGRNPDWDLKFSESDVSSVDAVAFFKLVGEEFDIELTPEELAEVQTMRELAKAVAARTG